MVSNSDLSPANKRLYPEIISSIFEAFLKENKLIYLVGPRARDIALENDIRCERNFDFTTNSQIDEIQEILAKHLNIQPSEEKREKGRTITYYLPYDGNPELQYHINVGTFRNYLPPLKSLRGHNLSGIVLDLATREVTIQGFCYDASGECLDPFNGIADLKNKILKPIFPTDNIFRESGGWLLKMSRYISRYGFDPASDVVSCCERDVANILDVPRDIWRSELEKILCGQYVAKALQFMHQIKLLSFILPEVEAMVGFSETCPVHHKDLWEHTKAVVNNSDPSPVVRWAALCHDIGKVWTRRVHKNGKVHFFRHEEMGALLFEGISHRFRLNADEERRISYIIKNHSRINLYREDWSDSAVRRLIADVGDNLDDLIAFSKADITSKKEERVEKVRSLLTDLQLRILEIKEKDAYLSPLRSGFGNVIMEHFGIEPGPQVGRLKEILSNAIISGVLEKNQPDEIYLKFLESHVHKSENEMME